MVEPTRILVVEDNPVTSEVLQRRLTERGYQIELAGDGEAALEAVRAGSFDLVLLDIMLPEMDGLQVLAEVRRDHQASDLPVVVLTVKEASEDVVEALRLGANDYVTKTVDFTIILARIETQLSLRRITAKVRELAVRDPLTSLFNRRGFYELAEKEESRARRYKTPLHALVIDIDHFKAVNDIHGHEIGDRVLVQVAWRLRGELRASDIIGRWGGEEFVVLLPGIAAEGALRTAERLRAVVEAAPVEAGGKSVTCTVSVGVASYDNSCANLSDLLGHGDRALYAAKEAGRNRVWAHDPHASSPSRPG